MGEGRFRYFDFFSHGETEWGAIPVWAYGTVEESSHPEIDTGEKLYGYFPMARHVVLTPKPGKDVGINFEVDRPQLPADRSGLWLRRVSSLPLVSH